MTNGTAPAISPGPFLIKSITMDLETFIAETLRQIVKGVETAQQHSDCKKATINYTSGTTMIDFDVAVTVSEGSNKQGKGNIGVASVFGIGGQANSTTANTSVSRIKFQLSVILPEPERR